MKEKDNDWPTKTVQNVPDIKQYRTVVICKLLNVHGAAIYGYWMYKYFENAYELY